MKDFNQFSVVGRLTRDAELKYTAAGTALSNFSVACNDSLKKGDQWVDEASFFDFTLWDKLAEGLSKYLIKGTQVVVAGRLKQERWERDGQNHTKVGFKVMDIQLVGSKRDPAAQEGTYSAPEPAPRESSGEAKRFDPAAYEDDIPF